MPTSVLYLIRGLPGNGKSTLAAQLTPFVFATDDYFEKIVDGNKVYDYVYEKLAQAHADCVSRVEAAMAAGKRPIAVANTFSQPWEMDKYIELAITYGYSVFVLECQNNFENTHKVPQQTIDAMRARWLPVADHVSRRLAE